MNRPAQSQNPKLPELRLPELQSCDAVSRDSSLANVEASPTAAARSSHDAATESEIRVLLRTPLWDYTGYADDGRQLAKALSLDAKVALRCEPLRWHESEAGLGDTEAALLRALCRAEPRTPDICITNTIPGFYPPHEDAAVNVLRTTFECQAIPESWLPHLDAFDEIWLFSEQSLEAFCRGGAAREKLRVVRSAVDTQVFSPCGPQRELPDIPPGSFLFFSTFDWQWRKGWDVLFETYSQTFRPEDGVALVAKITNVHGRTWSEIKAEIDGVLAGHGESLDTRPDIVLLHEQLAQSEMAELYRRCDAFVLPTRGEGWGRPMMEAMACGLPVIATAGSGQSAFLTDANAFLIDSQSEDVPVAAANEIDVFRGQAWWEPERESLEVLFREAAGNPVQRQQRQEAGTRLVQTRYSIEALRDDAGAAIRDLHDGSLVGGESTSPRKRIFVDGEIHAGHSFSNINEVIVLGLQGRGWDVGVSSAGVPASTMPLQRRRGLEPAGDRDVAKIADVTIRHDYPPQWTPPVSGKWVHIQPWEYGYLPRQWVAPLRDAVDEIWVPSQFVKRGFVDSGVAAERVHVIPWGIDTEIYRPDVVCRELSLAGRFAFLFAGGTIARKGFDLLFRAYLEEFSADDEVCLVVKDLGATTFYSYGTHRDELTAAMCDDSAPAIRYFDQEMSEGQRASLFAACDCLVMPYRGEGFALPVLEAMACGLAPMVPRGGPSDDYAPEESAYFLEARRIPARSQHRLCGPAMELEVSLPHLKAMMRYAYDHRNETRERGKAAAEHVHQYFSWDHSLNRMHDRLTHLLESGPVSRSCSTRTPIPGDKKVTLALLGADWELPDLHRVLRDVQLGFDQIVAFEAKDEGVQDVLLKAGVQTFVGEGRSPGQMFNNLFRQVSNDWILLLFPGESIEATTAKELVDLAREMPHSVAGVRLAVSAPWAVESTEQGLIARRELRLVRNRDDLAFQLAYGRDVAWSGEESAVVETDHAVQLAKMERVDWGLLHFDVSGRRRSATSLARIGWTHLLEGNPFHAECYLEEAYRLMGDSLDKQSILEQLCACHDAVGIPYLADELLREARQKGNVEMVSRGKYSPRSSSGMCKLFLGAGGKSLEGYVAVDVVPGPTVDIVHNLDMRPWPWEDQSVDLIVAEDVVEHLQINLIEFCNEAWRVLKPGGELYIRTPHHEGVSSWIDPTHRWHLREESFEFLDPDRHWGKAQPHYTPYKWTILSLGVRGPMNICAAMTPRY